MDIRYRPSLGRKEIVQLTLNQVEPDRKVDMRETIRDRHYLNDDECRSVLEHYAQSSTSENDML